jgi:hypothetical protein
MRILLAAFAALTVFACTDPEPLPGPACDDSHRAEYCKNSCPTDTCPGASQSVCETECRACAPDGNYCPPAP